MGVGMNVGEPPITRAAGVSVPSELPTIASVVIPRIGGALRMSWGTPDVPGNPAP
jgi:hypothetical protein